MSGNRKRVYIAGPMSSFGVAGLYNFPAFDAARDALAYAGYDVVSPADMDRAIGFDPAKDVPDAEWLRKALVRDVQAIGTCDMMALLDNWYVSDGATAEYRLAERMGLSIMSPSQVQDAIDHYHRQRGLYGIESFNPDIHYQYYDHASEHYNWRPKPPAKVPDCTTSQSPNGCCVDSAAAIPAREYKGRLVGLVGYAGVGKDTISQHLGWTRAAFADELKADLATVVAKAGLDPIKDKEIIRPLYVAYGKASRAVNPNVWIDRLRIPAQSRDVVITDVRYPNEAEFITARGGLLFCILRDGFGPKNDEERDTINSIIDNYRPIPLINVISIITSARISRRVDNHYRQAKAA